MRPLSVYSKYLYYLSHFGTRKKIGNILLNQIEKSQKKTVLESRPYKITIDPGNFCNLRCPGCHTGIKHPEMITPAFMTFNNYKTIFDQFSEYALSVALYNWGEPFLNKQIFSMIEYSRAHQVGTVLHSNFNVFNEKMAEDAVKSGLTHMYLSIDGATQETYSKYRVKGNLDVVMAHLKIMLETRKRLGSKFPLITWKFLVFEHNKHEIESARRKAISMGVDAFEVFEGYPKLTDIYDQAEEYRLNPSADKSVQQICSSLWSGMYINADGFALPCSLSYRENEKFGSLLDNTLSDVWNNAHYVNSRSMFTGKFDADKVPLPCRSCKHYLSRTCINGYQNERFEVNTTK